MVLQLDNETPFAAERAVLFGHHGEEIWTVIVKGTFDIRDGVARVAENQEPVVLAPEYHGEPGLSSLRFDTDVTVFKRSTDVLLNGHVYAPRGRPCARTHARLRIGSIDKRLAVYGDRVWRAGVQGIQPSSPRPFERMPILYERAFGGVDPVEGGAAGYEDRNPIGVGYAVRRRNLIDTPAPNIEDPTDPSRPIGFGAVSSAWQPRRGWLGTLDDRWRDERMPLYPIDLDPRFFQNAPLDQVTATYLHGGEYVELENLTPDGYVSFRLPKVGLGLVTLFGSELIPHRPALDTVILEPDASRVLLTWRSRLPCHGRKLDVKWTRVYEKEVVRDR